MIIDKKQNEEAMIKQPWLAVFLSQLLPGAGQIYGGKKTRGILFLFTLLFISLIVLISFYEFLFLEDAATTRLSAIVGIVSILILFVLSIYVLFDAHKVVRNYNTEHHLSIEKSIKRKPWLAVFLSYLLPGIGQFYNKQTFKGIALLITTVALYIASTIYYQLFILLIPLYFFALKDAFDSTEKINGSNQKFLKQENKLMKIFIIVMILLNLIPFNKIVKTYVIHSKAFKLPSGSMLPTLEIGDHILVDKSNKARDSIKSGDIVVFKYPEDETRTFMKRVIGIDGDLIEIKNKIVYRNSIPLIEPYAIHRDPEIKPKEMSPRDNFGPVQMPKDKIFVLGDNRDGSYDSRHLGYVPRENIEGKAFKIYWSWDSVDRRVRWDRIGKRIN